MGAGAAGSPVHTPILRLAGEPKSQKRPRIGRPRSVHNSLSCLAHTRAAAAAVQHQADAGGAGGAGPAGTGTGAAALAGGGARREAAVSRRRSRPPGPFPPPASSRRRPLRGLRCLPGCRGRSRSTKAQRTGLARGWWLTWSGRCSLWRAAARGGWPGGAARVWAGGGVGARRAAGLGAVGRGGCRSDWRRWVAAVGAAPAASLSGEELLCEAGAGRPEALYLRRPPGSPMS